MKLFSVSAFALFGILSTTYAVTRADVARAQDRPPREIAAAFAGAYPAAAAKQRRASSPSDAPANEEAKVVGGKDAVKGQFKWQVALVLSDAAADDPFSGFFCGGSLIRWRWILTAAHCTYSTNPQGTQLPPVEMLPGEINVYLGSHDFAGGERATIKRIVRQKYNANTSENDLALLELTEEPKDKSQLDLITLVDPAQDDPRQEPGRRATVLGWGSTAQGLVPKKLRNSVQILQYADVQFKQEVECNQHHLNSQRARDGIC